MDGDLDTAHISNLHQFDAIDDIPDDGTDKPGYPSGYMSMKFWRHDPRALIEVDETWHGFRYAGLRVTPNGLPARADQRLHLPRVDDHRADPVLDPADLRGAVRRRHTTYRYNFTTQPPANPRGLGGPVFFTYEKYPFEMLPPNGVVPRTYTRENDYRIDRFAQQGLSYSGIADFRSQDAMATETAGPIYDRTSGAPRLDRRRPDPDAPPAPAGGQGAGRRPGGGAAGPRRGGRFPRDPRRREDPRPTARTGASSAPTPTPSSRRRLISRARR